MARKTLFVIATAIIVLIAAAAIMGISFPQTFSFGEKIAVIKLEGQISSGSGIIPIAQADPENINKLLESANSDPTIKAVLLKINSAGGTPVASAEIASKVEAMNKTVVAYISETGASGAYWVAASANKIVAHPLSITCSIGAFTTTADMSGLFQKIGLNYTTIKSGELKDIGTSSRPLTEKEKALLQKLVDDINDEFINYVKERRNLTDTEISDLKDGRPCLGKDALAYGLVDKLGNEQDAIGLAKEIAKIKRPQIVTLNGQENLLSSLFGAALQNAFYAVGRGIGDSLVKDYNLMAT